MDTPKVTDFRTAHEALEHIRELSKESDRLRARYDQVVREKQMLIRESRLPWGKKP